MLNIKVKGQCVEAKLEGEVEQLVQELVMLNISLINRIVGNMQLKPGKNPLMAKLQLEETMSKCVKNGLSMNLGKELTASDLTKEAWGLDMDEILLQQMAMQELVNKWLPIMDEHRLSDIEVKVMQREVHEAGLTMEDFIDKLVDMKMGNKEVK